MSCAGLVTATLLAATPWNPGWILFSGSAGEWTAIDPNTRAHETIRLPQGYRSSSLALSSDRKTVFFTSKRPGQQSTLLYRWTRDSTPPVALGEQSGFYADPALSRDQKWLYFVHALEGGGPPGEHQAGVFGQIYRARPDGSEMTALTSERGCHFAPLPLKAELLLIHSDCNHGNALVRWNLAKRGPQRVLSAGYRRFLEPSLSPDGKHLLFADRNVDSVVIRQFDVDSNAERGIHEIRRIGRDTHPQFGASPREIYYQNANAIWLFDGASDQRINTQGESL